MPARGNRTRTPRFLVDLDRRVLPPLGRTVARLRRDTRRARVLTVLGVVVSVVGALIAVYTVTRTSEPTDQPGAIVDIGVARGTSIPTYVAMRRAALDALVATAKTQARPAPMYALVSFDAYLRPTDLHAVLAGVLVTDVFMRVPPGSQPDASHLDGEPESRIVSTKARRMPDDVILAMLAEANKKQQDVANYHTMQDQLDGSSAQADQLRAVYQQGNALALREERAYRSLCGCVFAAVVYGTPASLGALAADRSVRVVDPVPGLPRADLAVFSPPLPEQHGLADPPQGNADTFP